MELSVVIVNYNGLQYLKNCFDALTQNLQGVDYEIIVVDNNSVDESCLFITTNYNNIKLVASKDNLGFGRGNNLGVANAKYDNLLLINNDTIVLDDLKPVIGFLDSDDSIGALTIQMLDGTRKYVTSFGNFPNIYNMLWLAKLQNLGLDLVSGVFNQKCYELDWLSGSFVMMRKKVYNEIGGFDPDYFMYVEDVDFSKKIANLGYKRLFLPAYRYIHFVGFSLKKNPLLIKGFHTYINKHHSGFYRLALQIALKINTLIKKIKKEY